MQWHWQLGVSKFDSVCRPASLVFLGICQSLLYDILINNQLHWGFVNKFNLYNKEHWNIIIIIGLHVFKNLTFNIYNSEYKLCVLYFYVIPSKCITLIYVYDMMHHILFFYDNYNTLPNFL